jgi:hypothetical protein
MVFILSIFTPAFFAMLLSEYLWRWFFPKRRRRRRTFPRHYYLRMRVNRQVSWTRAINKPFLRRFVATLHQHQIWIFKRHGWTYKFFLKKKKKQRPALDYLDEPTTDDSATVLRNKLHVPRPLINEFLLSVCPLEQYRILKALSDPSLLDSKKNRNVSKKRCRQALIMSAALVQDNYTSNAFAPPTVYLSKKRNELPIVIDSGASYSVTPTLDDFLGPIEPCSTKELNGLNTSIKVIGHGTVEWKIQDLFGTVRSIKTKAFYVPDASVRLFSPQAYFFKNIRSSLFLNHKMTTLTLGCGTALQFPYNEGSSLPLMLTTKALNRASKFIGLTFQDFQTSGLDGGGGLETLLSVADETNQNLTAAQKELLLWHQRWGHADIQLCQMYLSRPLNDEHKQIIVPKHQRASSCRKPLCASCRVGKQTREGAGSVIQVLRRDRQDLLRQANLVPASKVSLDQFMSATHGRLPHTKGKEGKSKQYTGGTIFVDHATKYIHHSNQVSLRVGETLKAKNTFERFAQECGHKVQMYHADNAPFRAEEFVRDCTNKGQTIDYSGVGAHHQNGVAERAIRTVTSWARTMMLHQVLHWPSEARLDLWPFALSQAIYLWNNLPQRGTRLSPIELFTGNKFTNYSHLQRAHVWGCPVYVLDPTLQDGKKIPKWKPRARRGLYVGVSPQHSSTVGRVLSLTTGHVSDQFHCVYDDLFSTVNSPEGGPFEIDNFSDNHWTRLIESGYERHAEPEMDAAGNPIPFPEITDDWLSGPERRLRAQIRRERQEKRVRFRNRQRNPPERTAPPTPHFQRERGPGEPLPRVERERAAERAAADNNAHEAPPEALPPEPSVEPAINEDAVPIPTSIDSDSESDFSDSEDEHGEKYRLRSGREIRLTDDDDFPRTRSGRRVIPPDKLQANTATYKKRPGFPGQNLPANPCGSKENQKV